MGFLAAKVVSVFKLGYRATAKTINRIIDNFFIFLPSFFYDMG